MTTQTPQLVEMTVDFPFIVGETFVDSEDTVHTLASATVLMTSPDGTRREIVSHRRPDGHWWAPSACTE